MFGDFGIFAAKCPRGETPEFAASPRMRSSHDEFPAGCEIELDATESWLKELLDAE